MNRGVDNELFRPHRMRPPAFQAPVFLYVGRVAVDKNLDAFLDFDLSGSKVVIDEGPGVPSADRKRVFEPFYRVGPGTRGAGLGLNLVREIARLHGGRVEIKDSPTGTHVAIMFGARSHLR